MADGPSQLRDWMGRRGFSQQELAEYLAIEVSMLSLLINGKRNPGLTTAVAIERRTGIPVEAWANADDKLALATPQQRRKR